MVIRRELNYLPELLISRDFLLLNRSYDWWEDTILLVIYVFIFSLLVYTRRYFWSVLKTIPVTLYLLVTSLALLQYMGENAIIFPKNLGVGVEELAESIIYGTALAYLWNFRLTTFETYLDKSEESDSKATEAQSVNYYPFESSSKKAVTDDV